MEQEKSTEQIKEKIESVNQQAEQLSNLENRFQNFGNFFYQKICRKIVELNNISTINLIESIKPGEKITTEQFEILGCLSYMVGIDFCNQKYLHKDICERVYERFQHIRDFDEKEEVYVQVIPEIISAFSSVIKIITEDMLIDAKEELKGLYTGKIKTKPEEILQLSDMRNTVKSIFQNSIIPVNQAVNVGEYINKKDLSSEDIIKINSLVNRQCKYIGGNGIRPVIKLYQQPMWNSLLKKAVDLFDYTKYVIIYFDGILSLSESVKNLDIEISSVINFNSNSNIFDFEKIQEQYEEKIKSSENCDEPDVEPTEDNVPTNKIPYKQKSNEELEDLRKNDPFGVIYETLGEMLGYYIDNYSDLEKVIKILESKTDYAQNIYAYIKQNMDNVHLSEKLSISSIKSIVEDLDNNIKSDTVKYKELIEKACQPIPEDLQNNITSYVNSCINSLVIVTDEQKQTMISQLFENGITTFKHLEEIMSLIEQCDIVGKNLMSYVVLKQYLETTTNIVDIFDSYNKAGEMEFDLTLKMAFKEFFEKILTA